MKKNLFMLTVATMTMFTISSCAKVELNDPSELDVKFTAGVETRVTGNTWSGGDFIGVYQYVTNAASNCQYVATVSGTSPTFEAVSTTLKYGTSGNSQFSAYYPYNAQANDELAFDLSANKIDYLYSANNGEDYDAGRVPVLNFKPVMAKINFVVTAGSGMKTIDFTGTSIFIGGIKIVATFNRKTGVITPAATSYTTLAANGTNTYTTLIPPQSISTSIITITYKTSAGTTTTESIALPVMTFEAKNYTFNVTIESLSVQVQSTITERSNATAIDLTTSA